jgi:hypothetical protein
MPIIVSNDFCAILRVPCASPMLKEPHGANRKSLRLKLLKRRRFESADFSIHIWLGCSVFVQSVTAEPVRDGRKGAITDSYKTHLFKLN